MRSICIFPRNTNNKACLLHSFRVVLRCRQLAREAFAKLRSDVLVKLELLDNKHGIVTQLFCISIIFTKIILYDSRSLSSIYAYLSCLKEICTCYLVSCENQCFLHLQGTFNVLAVLIRRVNSYKDKLLLNFGPWVYQRGSLVIALSVH